MFLTLLTLFIAPAMMPTIERPAVLTTPIFLKSVLQLWKMATIHPSSRILIVKQNDLTSCCSCVAVIVGRLVAAHSAVSLLF